MVCRDGEIQAFQADDATKDHIVSVSLDLLAYQMKLLHLFVSFITEEIYQRLPNTQGKGDGARYPVWDAACVHDDDVQRMRLFQDAVKSVRRFAASCTSARKRMRMLSFIPMNTVPCRVPAENREMIARFIGASRLEIDAGHALDVSQAMPVAGFGFETYVFVREALDVEREMEKLQLDIQKTQALLEGVLAKLANEKFMGNAKPEAIEKEQSKKAEFEEKLEKNNKHLALLRSLA